ncbi:MAG TPA: hypothetical protein VHK90_16695 [Thermoanaerobaculia bacterium]|nr:hypothetical protein [Thermoanaerobaculia bacterium]
MTRRLLITAVVLLAACGGGEKESSPFTISRNPVSVRGWIHDVKGAKPEQSPDLEIARRAQLFTSTSVWVENAEFASGGIAENGAFVVLDVPPRNATLGFNAPGAETAKIVLENIPENADVLIPDVILQPNGATVRDPKAIVVRIAGSVDKPTTTGKTAKVAGYTVPVVEVPITAMMDRRDYPDPGGFRPMATVK